MSERREWLDGLRRQDWKRMTLADALVNLRDAIEKGLEAETENAALRTALLKIADYALAGTIEDAPWLQAIARRALRTAPREGGETR